MNPDLCHVLHIYITRKNDTGKSRNIISHNSQTLKQYLIKNIADLMLWGFETTERLYKR